MNFKVIGTVKSHAACHPKTTSNFGLLEISATIRRVRRQRLARAGFKGAKGAFQGSAVTGRSAETGELFDVGRTSDFDVALTGQELLDKARELGVEIRGSGKSTGPLNDEAIEKLGLTELRATLTRLAGGRTVHFKIFADESTAMARAPTIGVR
jgi:filamentous hemagglutinin